MNTPDEYIQSVMRTFKLANPQQIKWGHAVNTCAMLEAALNEPTLHFLECDVGYGLYRRGSDSGVEKSGNENDEGHKDLITAHFPTTTSSDLYFVKLVDEVRAHNQRAMKWSSEDGSLQAAPPCMKGLKIDFKHLSAVKACVELKKKFLKKIFGYLARCEFWAKIGLRFWILVG